MIMDKWEKEFFDALCNDFVGMLEHRPMPMQSNVIEEIYKPVFVVFNTDVVNCNDSIFIPYDRTFFELVKFKLYPWETLLQTLRRAYDWFMREQGSFPKLAMIPFMEYANFTAHYDATDPYMGPDIESVCKDLGIDYTVMIPDMIKKQIAPITRV